MAAGKDAGVEKKLFAAIACEDGDKWGKEDGICDRYIDFYREKDDQWTKFRAVSGEIPTKEDLDKYQGFMFSGGTSSVNDDKDWVRRLKDFIQLASQKNPRPKLVGICFGHQLLASALGGVVDRNPTGEFIFQSEQLEPSEQLKRKPSFSKVCEGGSIRLLVCHGECVKKLPEGATVLASSHTCEYEMVEFKENILGVQAHPDILQSEADGIILKKWIEMHAITKEKAESVSKSIWLPLNDTEMNEALKEWLHC